MKEYKREKCDSCKNIKETTKIFCDFCMKEIDYDGWNHYKHKDYLKLTLTDHFEYEPSESEGKDFCSWACLFKWFLHTKEEYDEIEFPELIKEHKEEFMSYIKNETD